MADVAAQVHARWDTGEVAEIRRQLERLLNDPHFSHSRRFPSFLRYVVQQTLAGQMELLKERTVGIEVFGKDASYDTALDPIVRVTAAEIRKRIAQYYQEPGHENELRITLPAGSYIPQFDWPKSGNDAEPLAVDPAHEASLVPSEILPAHPNTHSRRFLVVMVALTCVAAGLLSIGLTSVLEAVHQSAFNSFWQPVLSSRDPVLVCIADQLQYSGVSLRDAADPTRQFMLKDSLTAVVFDDLNATVKVAGILQSRGKQYSLKSEGGTNLEDLRSGPTIFIGAFDNAWTLRLTNSLRYHFANNTDMSQFRIVDSTSPAQSRWMVDRNVQLTTNNYRDYAIIARFTDVNTQKLAVVVAGIGRGGTIAAGEFLTDSNDLAQLKRAQKAAGSKQNLEIVISTQIIDGAPGSPRMEAVYFW